MALFDHNRALKHERIMAPEPFWIWWGLLSAFNGPDGSPRLRNAIGALKVLGKDADRSGAEEDARF